MYIYIYICLQEDLIKKIEYMGASFSSKLVGGTTHLVARNVLSIKYEVSPLVHAYGIMRFDVLIVVMVFRGVTYCIVVDR